MIFFHLFNLAASATLTLAIRIQILFQHIFFKRIHSQAFINLENFKFYECHDNNQIITTVEDEGYWK